MAPVVGPPVEVSQAGGPLRAEEEHLVGLLIRDRKSGTIVQVGVPIPGQKSGQVVVVVHLDIQLPTGASFTGNSYPSLFPGRCIELPHIFSVKSVDRMS